MKELRSEIIYNGIINNKKKKDYGKDKFYLEYDS